MVYSHLADDTESLKHYPRRFRNREAAPIDEKERRVAMITNVSLHVKNYRGISMGTPTAERTEAWKNSIILSLLWS
jgi:hypothetical protein